jgi:hypothetical protein
MNEEVKPGDVKRGVVPQREHKSGRVTPRDPKKVKLEYRYWPDEEWMLQDKYHTVADAQKACRTHSKNRTSYGGERMWLIDGQEFKP